MDHRTGIASGNAFATPNPPRPTDTIKSNLQAALGSTSRLLSLIEQEQYRLTGPIPVAPHLGAVKPEGPSQEGDLPEIVDMSDRLLSRMNDLENRLSFITQI